MTTRSTEIITVGYRLASINEHDALLKRVHEELLIQKHHGVELIMAPIVDGIPGHGVSSPVRAGCGVFNSNAIILDALEQEMHIAEIDTAKRKDRPWYRRGRF